MRGPVKLCAQVEFALLAHADVAECAVVGAPDEERGKIIEAHVVLKPGVAASPETARRLQDHVKGTLAPYKYPRSVRFVDALPKIATGKVQRRSARTGASIGGCMHKIIQPKNWPRPKGYANGVLAEGRMLFIAGQVGWNEREEFESEDFVKQTEQALKNIVAILTEADARPEHIARMTWYVTDKADYLDHLPEIGKVYSSVIGKVYPAMSLVQVTGLVEVGAKLEIEATAMVPS